MNHAPLEKVRCIGHGPCDQCGSKDNLAHYEDGGTHCFTVGCKNHTLPPHVTTGEAPRLTLVSSAPAPTPMITDGVVSALPSRGIRLETCERYGYKVGEYKGQKCHIAPFFDPTTRQLTTQKLRMKDKKFIKLGDTRNTSFFGQHLFNGGKALAITEGEIDCLSVSQSQGNKWPCVSLPDGAGSAERVVKEQYEWLDSFESIVLIFDMDEPGRLAAEKVAQMLPAGKVKIASLPLKDPNEMLKAGRNDELVRAFWDAKPWRPDGIVMSRDLRELVRTDDTSSGLEYPWECLTRVTRGIRQSELVTITAGSGIGKTTFVREIAYHLHHKLKQPVGMIMLEESNRRTLEGLVGLHLDQNILVNREGVTEDVIMAAFDDLFNGDRDITMYDHFGSTDVDNICGRIRYMAKVMGVKYVFLDHISILVSGLATGDERKLIDITMTKLRTLVQETGITLFAVSHLKRPQGDKGHEDGAEVHLGQLRGSHAIAQLSDLVIGLQKPSEGGDAVEVRVLKNRYTGEVGSCGNLSYNRHTGRLDESAF